MYTQIQEVWGKNIAVYKQKKKILISCTRLKKYTCQALK